MRAFVFALLFLSACGPPPAASPRAAPAVTTTNATSGAAPPASDPAPQANLAASNHWDHDLLQLMPQIDACLAKSPNMHQVSYAGPRGDEILVRLQGEEIGVDCHVRGGEAQMAPYDWNLHIDEESKALFIRGTGDNPGGDCYVAPEVRDHNGVLLGWMIDPEGC